MLQTGRTVTCLYMYDAIGNPLALTSNTSVTNLALEYDRHGAANRTDGGGLTGASALNPFEFQGGVQDRVTRQVKFGGRWYNPATGSWTAQDTLNAPLDPSNADRYVYAADDPINNAGLAGARHRRRLC